LPPENVPGTNVNDAPPPRRGGGVYARRGGGGGGGGAPGGYYRKPLPDRERQNNAVPKEKIQSKTAVFVANLPFSIDDEALSKIFEEFHVKTAHVVNTRTGRSRGYGFVDFESEKDQQAAIASKHNKDVLGANGKSRQISVTVSHSVAKPQQNEENVNNPSKN